MNKFWLLLLAVPLLLSLGCTGPKEKTQHNSEQVSPDLTHGGDNLEESNCEGDSCAVEPQEENNAEAQEPGSEESFEMGSYKCHYESSGSMPVDVWYKNGVYRMEMKGNDQIPSSVSIIDDNKDILYVKFTKTADMPAGFDCDWIKYDMSAGAYGGYNNDAFGGDVPESSGTMSFENIYQKYNCQPADVPDSLLTPSGKVCDMKDLFSLNMR